MVTGDSVEAVRTENMNVPVRDACQVAVVFPAASAVNCPKLSRPWGSTRSTATGMEGAVSTVRVTV